MFWFIMFLFLVLNLLIVILVFQQDIRGMIKEFGRRTLSKMKLSCENGEVKVSSCVFIAMYLVDRQDAESVAEQLGISLEDFQSILSAGTNRHIYLPEGSERLINDFIARHVTEKSYRVSLLQHAALKESVGFASVDVQNMDGESTYHIVLAKPATILDGMNRKRVYRVHITFKSVATKVPAAQPA